LLLALLSPAHHDQLPAPMIIQSPPGAQGGYPMVLVIDSREFEYILIRINGTFVQAW
jgi:hypothetical protein